MALLVMLAAAGPVVVSIMYIFILCSVDGYQSKL